MDDASTKNYYKSYEEVLTSNITAIDSISSALANTIGPKGLDVMLVDEFGAVSTTNDGVEILSNLQIKHPAAKLLVEVAQSQEKNVGDGTTTACLVTNSILNQALKLIQSGYGSNQICTGLTKALQDFESLLKEERKFFDNLDDAKLLSLVEISARADSTIAKLVTQAAKNTTELDENFADRIITSTQASSQVIEGLLIKKKTHFKYRKDFKSIKALVIDGTFEPDPISSEAVSTDEGVKKYEQSVQSLLECAKRIVKSNIGAVFASSSISPVIEEYLVKEGVFILPHVKKSDIETLLDISSAKLVTRLKIMNSDSLSISEMAGTLSEININKDLAALQVVGAGKKISTMVLNADTETILEEKKRICEDAAKALYAAYKEGYVMGAGVTELNIQTAMLEKLASLSNEQLKAGYEVFVAALATVFEQINLNAGISSQEIKNQIEFKLGNTKGYDFETNTIVDYQELGIFDPYLVKAKSYKVATEVSAQILRVCLILQTK